MRGPCESIPAQLFHDEVTKLGLKHVLTVPPHQPALCARGAHRAPSHQGPVLLSLEVEEEPPGRPMPDNRPKDQANYLRQALVG